MEAGVVLGDICAWASSGCTATRAQELTRLTGSPAPADEGAIADALRDNLCLLQKSYCFDSRSGIGSLTQTVNAGARTEMKATLRQLFDDIALHPPNTTEEYEAMLGAAQQGYERYLQLRRERAEPQAMLAAFSEFQLLCALHEGPYSAGGVNERLEQRLNRQRAIILPRHSYWYDGRPVMMSRNDSALGLFNGDIGIALEHDDELRMWFLMPDGVIESVQPSHLPEHDIVWTITVHKSQNSEFEHAALVLPARSIPLVTRELVYTAVTRTKQRLSLYADEQVLSRAIVARAERRSGLAEILAGREVP